MFLFYFFLCFNSCAGIVIASNALLQSYHNHGSCFQHIFSVPHPHADPLPLPFFFFLTFLIPTVAVDAGVGSIHCIVNDFSLENQVALSVFSPRGLGREPTEAGHPVQPPHGVRAWPRHHIIRSLKASWTESMEHKGSKKTYHPRPHPSTHSSDSFGM